MTDKDKAATTKRLNKYLVSLKDRLESSITPAKHVGHEAALKQYLEREIEGVKRNLEALKG
jgi:hypothetical protein